MTAAGLTTGQPADDDLVDRVRRRLLAGGGEPSGARVAAAVRAEGGVWGDHDLAALLRQLHDEVSGAGPLSALLRDPDVTDVLVNAPQEVWVDRGRGLERADVAFADEAAVRALVLRLIAGTGRRLDTAHPWVDARLPAGVRLHAVLPPVAPRGTVVSLRVQRSRAFSLDELITLGTVDAHQAGLLEAVVSARLAVVVTGGTGSGKTTLLTTLLGLVDPAERLVLVEDAAELRPARPHVVGLEARPPNVDGAGEVTLRDLVRQALRMRPDRLVVGEVRGVEVVDLLAALNTGHDGGMTTLHANSVDDVPARFEALASPAGLDRAAVHAQLAAGVQVVIHLRRAASGLRIVSELGVLERASGGVRVVAAVTRATRAAPTQSGLRLGPGARALRAALAARGVSCAALPEREVG
jgi:pilus assembly protein CpaF